MTDERHFIRRTITESFAYDPVEIDRLWPVVKGNVPDSLLAGDEDTDEESRIIAVFSAYDGSIVSPFDPRDDFDSGHELYVEDEDGNRLHHASRATEREAPPTLTETD